MPTVGEMLRNEGRLEGRQEGRLEGRQEGRLEGRQEGRLEGRQEDILLLLAQKFDKVSKARRNQVMKAGKADLDAWMGRILEAENIDAVFGEAARN